MRKWRAVILGTIAALLIAIPTQAAEQIYFNYGLLGISVPIQALETFVQTGKAEGTLGYYLSRFSAQRQAQLREVLQARYEVDPVMVDRFSYTTSGEKLLTEVGDIVKTAARRNGLHSLRAAAILAAADKNGFSALNLLHQLPTDMRIEIGQVLKLVRLVSSIVHRTEQSIATLEQQTAANQQTLTISNQRDIRDPGTASVSMQTLSLHDATRDRTITLDLYLPQHESSSPVIVISNGLGARRDRFDELAQHLASYGFAVVALDHPGSDRQRLEAFYAGAYRENFDASEYIDRPLDITYVLNELAQRPDLQGKLDVQRTGVFGYSFGGTTALSLAGGAIDLQHLQTDCRTQPAIINISLLYQCRALELPQPIPVLKDDRVKAVYLFVPFGKSLFAQTGVSRVNVPVLWEATDQDILTPLSIEQLPSFSWLTTPDKYLAVAKGLPHARLTLDVLNRLTNRSLSWDQLRPITQAYHNALSLAFFKVYVAQDEQYRPYLQASYARVLTEKPYSLSWVRSFVVQ